MDVAALFENPKTWITLAFILLIGGLFKRVSKMLATTLDARSAKIDEELAQARKLRVEAEEILALYKTKQAEYFKEAEQILKEARVDADNLAAHADAQLKLALDARTQHALQKIAQEEVNAIAEVRQHIIDISLSAARAMVVDYSATVPKNEALTLALTDIERKIH